MSILKDAVKMVIVDQRGSEPSMTASEALERALKSTQLHRLRSRDTDDMSNAYRAVLRHPSHARFAAREIERHEWR